MAHWVIDFENEEWAGIDDLRTFKLSDVIVSSSCKCYFSEKMKFLKNFKKLSSSLSNHSQKSDQVFHHFAHKLNRSSCLGINRAFFFRANVLLTPVFWSTFSLPSSPSDCRHSVQLWWSFDCECIFRVWLQLLWEKAPTAPSRRERYSSRLGTSSRMLLRPPGLHTEACIASWLGY